MHEFILYSQCVVDLIIYTFKYIKYWQRYYYIFSYKYYNIIQQYKLFVDCE